MHDNQGSTLILWPCCFFFNFQIYCWRLLESQNLQREVQILKKCLSVQQIIHACCIDQKLQVLSLFGKTNMCTRSLKSVTWLLRHRQRLPNQSLIHPCTCPALLPRSFHGSLQLSSLHTAALVHTNRTVLRKAVPWRNVVTRRTFKTKAKGVGDSLKVKDRKKGRWKKMFAGFLLGTTATGAVYYLLQDVQEKRRMRVFVGGVQRFLR